MTTPVITYIHLAVQVTTTHTIHEHIQDDFTHVNYLTFALHQANNDIQQTVIITASLTTITSGEKAKLS